MIFDIRNMLILTIKNLIKRMIYNKKKLSSFEELGYSNVVNISKYLSYQLIFQVDSVRKNRNNSFLNLD